MGFWNRDDVTTTDTGIRVQDLPNDRPQFNRRYTARVNDYVSLKVELRSSYGGSRFDMSELDQSNGKWVLFDLSAPADKILDRDILPTVEKLCEEIVAIDAAYIRSAPSEFVDEAGVKWRRVNSGRSKDQGAET